MEGPATVDLQTDRLPALFTHHAFAARCTPMHIAQITFSYLPLRGGGDVYAEQLRLALEAGGHRVTVYQEDSGARAPYVRPLWVAPGLPAGRRFWLLTLALAARAGELARYHRLIVHYPPYLLPLAWHPGLIGLSHGITWDDAPASAAARVKKRLAAWAFRRSAAFVANDSLFFREMGLSLPPGEGRWEEIVPGRWLLPNTCGRRFLQLPAADPGLVRLHPLLVPRNLYRNRGIDLALEAFAGFHREWPQTHLLIAGGVGQPDYAREIHRRVEEMGLQRHVLFHGSVPWDRMGVYYASAEVTLIPSVAGEGTSLAALESMACGTATLLTTAGGLPDLPGPHAEPSAAGILAGLRALYPRRREWGAWQQRQVMRHFPPQRWEEGWRRVVAGTPAG